MTWLAYVWFLVCLSYLVTPCSGSEECQEIQVSGLKAQKGVEGKYQRSGRCEDLGDTAMYEQTYTAPGWGSIFYLYYFNDPESYQGWIFSLYPCSDIEFVRSSGSSRAVSPDLVQDPWEEYVTDKFIPNSNIKVTCTDRMPTGMIIALTFIALLSVLSLVTTIIIFVKFSRSKKRRAPHVQRTDSNQTATQNELSLPSAYFPPSPPPYSELQPDPLTGPPPHYHSNHTRHSMNYYRLSEEATSAMLPQFCSLNRLSTSQTDGRATGPSATGDRQSLGATDQNKDHRHQGLPPSYEEATEQNHVRY